MMAARILICDDEPGLREMLCVLLRRAGYSIAAADCKAEALELIGSLEPFDAVITDLALPDGSGMEVLSAATERDERTQVLMITAYGTTEQAVMAMKLGAYDYVQKPFKNHELLVLLDKALDKGRILVENKQLRASIEEGFQSGGLIGRSVAMRAVMDMVQRVAGARTSVLITGESGTGKEVVARALHDRGQRAEGAFVVVNCGALPEMLMESELFGHEKGAFTGANRSTEGLVRESSGGTLFLDEVGELPAALQVKLLRVLQERKVRPVGGARELEVDLRVVAATNLDLEAAVEDGRFREDLFYRLNVIRLELPPLRERPEDIPPLAKHFLLKHAAFAGKALQLSSESLAWVSRQTYKGNVRELENVIERAVTLAAGPRIELSDVATLARPSARTPVEVTIGEDFDLDVYLGEIEKRLLLRALERTGGARKKAAKLVGMTFRSFRYRLAKYDLGDGEE